MRDRKKAQALAHELVSKMTIEERASQLKFDAPPIERLGVPAYYWWNEARKVRLPPSVRRSL